MNDTVIERYNEILKYSSERDLINTTFSVILISCRIVEEFADRQAFNESIIMIWFYSLVFPFFQTYLIIISFYIFRPEDTYF